MSEDEDITVEPDLIVSTALRQLPIPAHGPDFWTLLEQALDAEDPALVGAGAGTGGLAAVPDQSLALVPPALRRTSNVVLVAVAAAALLVVAFAGSTLIDERDGDTTEVASEPTALSGDAEASDTTAVTLTSTQEEASTEAVMDWVDAVDAGDTDAAWSSLSATAQSEFGTEQAFSAELASLSTSYDPWADAEPTEVLVTPLTAAAEDTLVIVTLVGSDAAEAFAVRFVDGSARLEPFARAGAVELVVPEPASDGSIAEVGAGEELVFVVPDGGDAPVLRLDDGAVVICGESEGTELTPLDDLPAQRCAYTPEEPMAPGEHTLTVAVWSSDGIDVSAESVLFEAA